MEQHGQLRQYSAAQLHTAEILLGVQLMPQNLTPEQQQLINIRQYDVRATAVDLAHGLVDAAAARNGGVLSPLEHMRLIDADEARAELHSVAQQVVVANNLLAADTGETVGESKRSQMQHSVLGRIYDWGQTYVQPDAEPGGIIPNAMLVTSPTGSGKTVLQARILSHAGVGLPTHIGSARRLKLIENEMLSEEHPLDIIRGLVVVSSQQLMEQYLGVSGNDTFRRFFGRDVRITSYWQESKDASGELVLVTRQSLPKAIAKGDINPADFAVTVVDEAHHLLGRQMQTTLGKLATSRIFAFTATPAYKEVAKDLRTRFETVSTGSMREFVEQGILNPVSLYSFKETEKGSGERIAVSLAEHYIKQGRKVAVYCRPGANSLQARNVVAAINARFEGDSVFDEEPAAAVGDFQSKAENKTMLQAFADGKRRLLATVGMLKEGWDEDVDAVILLGTGTSRVDVEQACGRAMRPGQHDTVIAEILPAKIKEGHPVTSIFSVFGIEEFAQGYSIAPPEPDKEPRLKKEPQTKLEQGSDIDNATDQQNPEANPEPQDEPEVANAAETDLNVPASVIDDLTLPQPIRRATVAPADLIRMGEIEEGYAPIRAFAEANGIYYRVLCALLDKQGFNYVSVSPKNEGELFDRWYGPETHAWLAANSPVDLIRAGEYTIGEIADMAEVSRRSVDRYFDDLPNPPETAQKGKRKGSKGSRLYSYDVVEMTINYFAAIPEANEGDVPVVDLIAQIGERARTYIIDPNHGITPQRKRPHPDGRKTGRPQSSVYHVTAQEARQVLEACSTVRVATIDYMHLGDVAAIAGVANRTVLTQLTEDERSSLVLMRATPQSRQFGYLPAALGMQVAERFRPQKLPLDRVILPIITARSSVGRNAVLAVMQRSGFDQPLTKMNLGGPLFGAAVYSWDAMRAVEEIYPPKGDMTAADYSLLGSVAARMSAAGLVHARQLLGAHLEPHQMDLSLLEKIVEVAEEAVPVTHVQSESDDRTHEKNEASGPPPEWVGVTDACRILRCTPAALAMMFASVPHDRVSTRREEGTVFLHQKVLVHLRTIASHARDITEGWVSHRVISKSISDEFGVPLDKVLPHIHNDASRLCRTQFGIDVSYDPSLVKHMRQVANQLKKWSTVQY